MAKRKRSTELGIFLNEETNRDIICIIFQFLDYCTRISFSFVSKAFLALFKEQPPSIGMKDPFILLTIKNRYHRLMKWSYRMMGVPHEEHQLLLSEIVRLGKLKSLKWFVKESKAELHSNLTMLAIICRKLKMLKWLLGKGVGLLDGWETQAIKYQHLTILRYMIEEIMDDVDWDLALEMSHSFATNDKGKRVQRYIISQCLARK
jgi:hypothetical protein